MCCIDFGYGLCAVPACSVGVGAAGAAAQKGWRRTRNLFCAVTVSSNCNSCAVLACCAGVGAAGAADAEGLEGDASQAGCSHRSSGAAAQAAGAGTGSRQPTWGSGAGCLTGTGQTGMAFSDTVHHPRNCQGFLWYAALLLSFCGNVPSVARSRQQAARWGFGGWLRLGHRADRCAYH
jgi:hypothetical protein